jgi:hypothetical protein
METRTVHLHRASDAEDSFALALEGDSSGTWRATRGFGQDFQRIWSVELQSERSPDVLFTDWDAVLERVIEAYDLNDPVITDFDWPRQQTA